MSGLRNPLSETVSEKIIRTLHAAGYRILAPGEADGETVERCAKVADDVSRTTLAQEAWDPDDDDYSCEAYEEAEYAASVASSVATRIRALKEPGQ